MTGKASVHRGNGPAHVGRLYGMIIEAPFPLPCAPCSDGPVDIRFIETDEEIFEEARDMLVLRNASPDWFECLQTADGADYLRWEDLFEFLVAPDGRTVSFVGRPGTGPESLAAYLLGQVVSFALLRLGHEPIHASVVEEAGRGLALLGEGGTGKSTLAAALLATGARLITDDLLVVTEQDRDYVCETGPARIKLYPGVRARLLPSVEQGEPMHGETDKRVVPLPAERCSRPADRIPLAHLVVLDARKAATGPPPALRRLRPAEAFPELVRHTFNTIVDSTERLERQFHTAAALAERVPVSTLLLPDDLARIGGSADLLRRALR